MPAPKGNTLAERYKSDEEKQEIYRQYCEHLSKGYSKESFVPCDYRTVESYVEKYPDVLPPEKMQQALRKGQLWWEKTGMGGMLGKLDGPFSSGTWVFNMKNRYGWTNKQEIDHTSGGKKITDINITVHHADDA